MGTINKINYKWIKVHGKKQYKQDNLKRKNHKVIIEYIKVKITGGSKIKGKGKCKTKNVAMCLTAKELKSLIYLKVQQIY